MRSLSLVLLISTFALAACSNNKGNGNSGLDRGDAGTIPDVERPDPDSGADAGEVGSDAGVDIGPDTPDVPPPCENVLSAGSPTSVLMEREDRRDISAVLEDCNGDPVSGVIIEFGIVGEANGSDLRNTRARTDASGAASVQLISGPQDATFDVEAAFEEQVVPFGIRVSGEPLGDLEVTIVNSTAETLGDYSAFLFTGVHCATIDIFDPRGALDVAEPILAIDRPTVFSELDPGTGYAVAVQGRDADGAPLGFGCVEDIEIVDATTKQVTVMVDLIPVVFTGIYELDNRLDLAGVLPPSVEDTLRILDELTDDHHVAGNASLDSWGVDPAAFILDFVYRQFCCWTAVDTDPVTPGFQGDFASCNSQEFTHATGDLEELYRRDFFSWEGAQANVPLLCGGLELGNQPLQVLLQDLIETNVPSVVLNLLTIAGDLSRAVTDMNIISELTIGDIAVGKNGTFTHTLEQMIVELHDLDGEVMLYAFDLADAGFENLEYSSETTASEGNVLHIPEHSFRLDFGRLLRFVFTDILLPTLNCDRDHDGVFEPCESTADLFGTWVDCVAVGNWLATEIGVLPPATFRNFCNVGVDAAGSAVEDAIEGSVDAETTITLEGTVHAGSVDLRREATTLVDGVWAGQLVEDGVAYGEFPGTFVGQRTADLD